MYFLRPMIITAIAVFTGSTILILLVLLVFLLLKKLMFFYLSIGWWTEAGRFWSCESIRHSCQMLLCWGEQTLTCSLNVFISSSIHVISGLGREALRTMAYTKEALPKRGKFTCTLFRPFNCRYSRCICKGKGFTSRNIWSGREICR